MGKEALHELVITAAKVADARAITQLRRSVAEQLTSQFGEGQWSAPTSSADVRRQMRASHMLVAKQHEHVIGCVRLATVNPRSMSSAGFTPVASALYVLGLAVAPDMRRIGVGRELLEAAKDVARARRAEALWLDAFEGQVGAFYERCGFRRVGPVDKRRATLQFYEWLVD
jgi:predicted N-acetyltransferase YhbS